MNKDLADKIENFSYMRKFSPEEISEMKDTLTSKVIEVKRLESELKAYNDSIKQQMKPEKESINTLAVNLKNKAKLVTESCYVEFDRESGIAYIYNTDGEQVGHRAMTIEERDQFTIKFKKAE